MLKGFICLSYSSDLCYELNFLWFTFANVQTIVIFLTTAELSRSCISLFIYCILHGVWKQWACLLWALIIRRSGYKHVAARMISYLDNSNDQPCICNKWNNENFWDCKPKKNAFRAAHVVCRNKGLRYMARQNKCVMKIVHGLQHLSDFFAVV